jgi:processive 1,2-diacylglycerol beta-glucosyltransferase
VKIFIIYASAGFGHKKIAEAVNEVAVLTYPGSDVRLIDALDYATSFFKFTYTKGYIFAVSKLSWLWAMLFFLSDTKSLRLINDNFRRFTNKYFCSKFLNFLKEEQPDFIISTHFLVNELVSLLKEEKGVKTKLISIITDFGVHNFWLAKNVDIYVAASQLTKKMMVSKNVNEKNIKVLGLPVRRQFEKNIDINSVRERLKIAPGRFTVSILTGGIGMGPIYKIVKLLEDRINVIVICGNNKKLYQNLKIINYHNLTVLGWVDYVEEVMAVSDLIITKPGGSTISECLIMNLPMIFFSIIPGQEAYNAEVVSKCGLGYVLKKPKEIVSKVLYFKDSPNEIKNIRSKISEFKKASSSSSIINLINDQ